MFRLVALCVITVALGHGGVVSDDEVNKLPGWDGPLPSKMYSGYLDATPAGEKTAMSMHYIFVESEGNPATDPLLIWSNGGPGAGSEFGLFTEIGPFYLSDQSLKTKEFITTGIPSLIRNNFAWTKHANVLVYDSPPPVGFSYCGDNPGGDGYSCGNWDDYRTAKAAHKFVENWMKAFPKYASHDLFLSGESYAGVYIPMLAREILNDDQSTTKDRLKGIAIGDGCVGSDVICGPNDPPWLQLKFLYGHGQVSTKRFEDVVDTCGITQLKTGISKKECKTKVDDFMTSIGGMYAYGLYDECGAENVLSVDQMKNRRYWSNVPATRLLETDLQGALNDYPCGGVGAMLKWLNTSAVKSALNVPKEAFFFLTDNGVGFPYDMNEPNLLPFFERVARNTSVRVLIYNGDTDPYLNTFVGENWTINVGLEEKEAWRAWTLDGKQRMGGYVTRYAGDFDYLTIRGAGHMVPEFKPPAGFELISRFLKGEEYKRYSAAEEALIV